MAVIGKIRQRAGLLIGIVGFSLVAFILGDLLTQNKRFISDSGTDIAEIGGKKIDIREFESMVQTMEDNYKLNTGNQTIDATTMESLREQAWTQLLNEQIMNPQYDKVGVKVSPEELFDMIQGKNPHQQIKDAFKDPKTGEFSPSNVLQFLKNMDNDPSGKTRAQWVAFEKYLGEERRKEKYNQLIRQGLFTTTAEAKTLHENQGKQAYIRFIDFNYNTVVDSTVKVDDQELHDYYNKHQSEFEQEASRKIEYVVFDVIPSPDDRKVVFTGLENIKTSFAESNDDSLFVAVNSDNKSPINFYKQGSLPPVVDTVFFGGAPNGTVVGPYDENNLFKIAKLIEVATQPDSLKVSHALIAYAGAERAAPELKRTKEQAQAIADSLMAIIKKTPGRFDDIARFQSDDKVASEKGGDLEWITQDSPMDPKFKEGAFKTAKGEVTLVESNFGFHLIKVTDQTAPVHKAKVAIIDRRIEPGKKTYDAAFAKANEFAIKYNTEELFNKAIQEQGLNKRVAENLKETDRNIAGLESPRPLIKWAYESEKGMVSKPYDFGEKFVIGLLADVKDKGIAPFEQAAEMVKGKVITQKKASSFIEKINAKRQNVKKLDELAAALGVQVRLADRVNFASSYVANLGVEPAVVANVFTLKPGQISAPIEGTAGVYVIVLDKIDEPAATTDYSSFKNQAVQQLQQRASYEVFNALKEKAKVEDNRGKFY